MPTSGSLASSTMAPTWLEHTPAASSAAVSRATASTCFGAWRVSSARPFRLTASLAAAFFAALVLLAAPLAAATTWVLESALGDAAGADGSFLRVAFLRVPLDREPAATSVSATWDEQPESALCSASVLVDVFASSDSSSSSSSSSVLGWDCWSDAHASEDAERLMTSISIQSVPDGAPAAPSAERTSSRSTGPTAASTPASTVSWSLDRSPHGRGGGVA
mmetsp:Transcript_42492/g.112476  ORF Transcript_42492/g.112476 Transcript_42492/m.112476 type:complete len:220 (+) Transcript_42492:603-1262(+)